MFSRPPTTVETTNDPVTSQSDTESDDESDNDDDITSRRLADHDKLLLDLQEKIATLHQTVTPNKPTQGTSQTQSTI